MVRVYIDSNVFSYAKVMDRVFGKPCSELLKSIASGETKAAVSALVPLEVASALVKYGLAGEVQLELRAIASLGLEVYPLDGSDAREVAEVYRETKVSPYDCAHAVVMKRYGLKEIATADRDFDKFDWIERIDPRHFKAKL